MWSSLTCVRTQAEATAEISKGILTKNLTMYATHHLLSTVLYCAVYSHFSFNISNRDLSAAIKTRYRWSPVVCVPIVPGRVHIEREAGGYLAQTLLNRRAHGKQDTSRASDLTKHSGINYPLMKAAMSVYISSDLDGECYQWRSSLDENQARPRSG